jgi:threonine/homoserine efflux transporter RhtA
MRTWALMYALIWVSFLQIIIVLFPILGSFLSNGLHLLTGILIAVMAYNISVRVRSTSCPDRIKRITLTTRNLSVFEGLLSIPPYLSSALGFDLPFTYIIDFLHVVIAIAIITQASASANAFDMWKEKEFLQLQKSGRLPCEP